MSPKHLRLVPGLLPSFALCLLERLPPVGHLHLLLCGQLGQDLQPSVVQAQITFSSGPLRAVLQVTFVQRSPFLFRSPVASHPLLRTNVSAPTCVNVKVR
eukprot:tig00000388_g24778.t1